jgi:hypothetical protein
MNKKKRNGELKSRPYANLVLHQPLSYKFSCDNLWSSNLFIIICFSWMPRHFHHYLTGLPPQPPCHQLKIYNTKWGESGSNPQPQPTKDCVLPLGYFADFVSGKYYFNLFVHKTNHMLMINRPSLHRHTEREGCCSLSVTASPHPDLLC